LPKEVKSPAQASSGPSRGGSLDGQLRLGPAGPTPTLTVRHQLDGQWWTETYAHDGTQAEAPIFGSVPDLVFRERRRVGRDLTRDRAD